MWRPSPLLRGDTGSSSPRALRCFSASVADSRSIASFSSWEDLLSCNEQVQIEGAALQGATGTAARCPPPPAPREP